MVVVPRMDIRAVDRCRSFVVLQYERHRHRDDVKSMRTPKESFPKIEILKYYFSSRKETKLALSYCTHHWPSRRLDDEMFSVLLLRLISLLFFFGRRELSSLEIEKGNCISFSH